MKTKITELLGIEYPVIQGGMAWVADYHLAAAVSEAGGLGLIGAGGAPASFVREQIEACQKLTDKPFGVDLMLLNPEADAIAQAVVDLGVKVVTTGAGSPEKYMSMWKRADEGYSCRSQCRSGQTYGTLWCGCHCRRRHGIRRAYRGIDHDGFSSPGCGCGEYSGDCCRRHWRWPGDGSSFDAGGPGCSRWGHAFCWLPKPTFIRTIKIRWQRPVILIRRLQAEAGHPIRCLRNPMTKAYLKMEKEGATFEELELLTLGSLKKAVIDGDVKGGSMMAGQIAGLVSKQQTCREIVQEIISECQTVIELGFKSLVQ